MELGGDSDIEAALVGFLRFLTFCSAELKVIINGIMEVFNKLFCILPLIGNQCVDARYFSVEQRIRLRKLHCAYITFVFNGVIHIRSSSS